MFMIGTAVANDPNRKIIAIVRYARPVKTEKWEEGNGILLRSLQVSSMSTSCPAAHLASLPRQAQA